MNFIIFSNLSSYGVLTAELLGLLEEDELEVEVEAEVEVDEPVDEPVESVGSEEEDDD